VQEDDWVASLDLNDAYLHVPITSVSSQVSQVHIPRETFRVDIPSVWNLSSSMAVQEDHIAYLPISPSEGQPVLFIGALLRLELGRLQVPWDRWETIQTVVTSIFTVTATFCSWQKLLGLLTSAQDLTFRGWLHIRWLQMFLNPYFVFDQPHLLIPLPDNLRVNLCWWTIQSNVLEGIFLQPFIATPHMFVDASLEGWGAHYDNQMASGLWSPAQQVLHINVLELLAVVLAIRHWRHRLQHTSLMIATDNVTAAAFIHKMGGTHSGTLLAVTYQLYELVDSIPLAIRARRIPGTTNILADELSRPSSPQPTDWMLHPEAFRWVCHRRWTPILDLFATRFNH